LLRGEGEMKKGDEWKVTQFIPVPNNELVDALKDHIASLKAENEHLRKEIEEYRREKSGAAVGYGYMAAEGTPLTKTE
jgi:predicted RNase H-like nuclease (RuvC/YqgF family)